MNAASFQISAVLAAKATLRDGQYGCVCVPFISAHIKRRGRVCGVQPSVPGVYCFHAEGNKRVVCNIYYLFKCEFLNG